MTDTAAKPSFASLLCPFVGLRSFREEDAPFFFGRERDIRVIASNVLTTSLTVLYGPSGVGKSSVLQAGVIPFLRASSDTCVVYFNTWQGEHFLRDLTTWCASLLPPSEGHAVDPAVDDIDKIVERAPKHLRFLLVFDQFEEYLRYQPDPAIRQKFESSLARLVDREDLPGNILIGIREDSLWMLDQRFGVRIANLLGNTLAVEHLTSQNAATVITGPIRKWNDRYGTGNLQASIDDDLVSTLLDQVQSENITTSEATGKAKTGGTERDRIEIAFLQLVLEELWTREAEGNSFHLRLKTLTGIGGADTIVQTYVTDILNERLNDRQRYLFSEMVRHLVTPSGTKFAQQTGDLIVFAKAPAEEVGAVLNLLTGETGFKKNLLRMSPNPEKYEIAHDILAQPILDWRLSFVQKRDREEKELELQRTRAIADAEARGAKRLRWMMAALLAVFAVTAVLVVYVLIQRGRLLEAQQAVAQEANSKAEAVLRAQQLEQMNEARRAEAAGNKDEAIRLRGEAAKMSAAADELKKSAAQSQQQSLTAFQQQKDQLEKRFREAESKIGPLQRERDTAQAKLTAALEENRSLQSRIDQLEKKPAPVTPTLNPDPASMSLKLRDRIATQTGINDLAFSRDGQVLAAADEKGRITIWDAETGARIRFLDGHTGRVNTLAFIPVGQMLFSGADDNSIKFWNASIGTLIRTLSGHSRPVTRVVARGDGKMMASSSLDQTIKIWDVTTGKVLRTLTGNTGTVFSLAISPNGRFLASGGSDATIRVWDVASGKDLRSIGHGREVTALVFSQDGRTLFSGSPNGQVSAWNTDTGEFIRSFSGHKDRVRGLARGSQGRILVSGSDDKTIRLWDTATGMSLRTFTEQGDAVYSVVFSPDGRTLASGSPDRKILLWSLTP